MTPLLRTFAALVLVAGLVTPLAATVCAGAYAFCGRGEHSCCAQASITACGCDERDLASPPATSPQRGVADPRAAQPAGVSAAALAAPAPEPAPGALAAVPAPPRTTAQRLSLLSLLLV